MRRNLLPVFRFAAQTPTGRFVAIDLSGSPDENDPMPGRGCPDIPFDLGPAPQAVRVSQAHDRLLPMYVMQLAGLFIGQGL